MQCVALHNAVPLESKGGVAGNAAGDVWQVVALTSPLAVGPGAVRHRACVAAVTPRGHP